MVFCQSALGGINLSYATASIDNRQYKDEIIDSRPTQNQMFSE